MVLDLFYAVIRAPVIRVVGRPLLGLKKQSLETWNQPRNTHDGKPRSTTV